MALNGSSPSVEDDKPIQTKVSIKKRNYGAIKKVIEKMGCTTLMGVIVYRGRWNLAHCQMQGLY